MKEGDFGKVSEWNEGNWKNLRLHEAQETINHGKTDPFIYSQEYRRWNYVLWKGGIDVLFGEGMSKYSEEEIERVLRMKKIIETFLELKTPFKKIYSYGIGGRKEKYVPVKEDQSKIKEYLEKYEQIVKKYNDEHGLSTRNRDDMDDGL